MNVWERGRPTVVVWDEALRTLPSSGGHPEARRIYEQGRARGLTNLAGTQSVNWVDTIIVKLTEHFVCFRVPNLQEAKLILDRRGVDPAPLMDLGPYWFGHHHLTSPEWTIYPPVEAILGKNPTMKRATLRAPANGAMEPERGAS